MSDLAHFKYHCQQMYKSFITFFLILVSLQIHSEELETIEITPVSILESEATSPVPIKIITAAEIKAQGATRLQDVLYLKEGVSFVRSGTKLAPSIRGFSPEHTLFLIDGQRIANEPTNKYDLERMDLINIERIEIIKGPLSNIYGPDALGGVINLITKKVKKDKVALNLRNSTYDAKSPKNSISAQADKKLGPSFISVFATHIKEDPLYYNVKESIDDKKEINSVGAGLGYQKGKVEFRARQTFSNDTHESLYYNYLNSSYVYDADRHHRNFSSGELKLTHGDIRHITMLSHSTYKKSGDTHLQSDDTLLMRKRARIYVTQLAHRTEVNTEDHLLTVGINHRREDFYGNAFNYKNRSKYLPEYYSLYLIDQWAYSERLIIVPSLRQDRINYFEDKLLGQLGATLSLDDKMEKSIKFNFSQGYRVPTPKDLYVDVMIMKGNPDLKSETTNAYNLEYHQLNSHSDFKIAFFYNQIDHLIQEYYDPALSKYSFRNSSQASIKGSELFVRKRFSKHENSLGHTFLDATESDGERLPNRARHQALFNTTWFFEPFSLSNDLNCRIDELLYNRRNTLEEYSYCSFDLALTYQAKKYQVLLKTLNLFDYYKFGLPQRPRLLTLALNTEF